MSYRDAIRPCSRVSSGEKNNTYPDMQCYKTATKNLEAKFSSNLEPLTLLGPGGDRLAPPFFYFKTLL